MSWSKALAAILFLASGTAWACPTSYPFQTGCSLPSDGLNRALAVSNSVTSGTILGRTAAGTGAATGLTTLPSALTIPSPAFSGTSTGTFTLGGTVRVNGSGSYDLTTIINPTRYALWDLSLGVGTTTTNIWEGLGVFYTLGGPGSANGEINHFHANFTVLNGGTSAQSEGYESKTQNSGTITERNEFLAIPQNTATGTATRLFGLKCQLTQANAAGAAVGDYACIDNEVVTGGGSSPTANRFLRNADTNAVSSFLGYINIGTLNPQNVQLYIEGLNSSGGTFPVIVKNSGPTNIFYMENDGAVTVPIGPFKLGTANNWGKLLFGNVTSGAIQLNAPSSGALGSSVLTLPIATDTLVGKATTDAFTNKTIGGTSVTLSSGELGFTKITATAQAPGASGGKIEMVCGTNAGSVKIIAYGGTSTTPVTITDNIGSGVSGC